MPDRTRTGRQLSISGLVLVLNLACAAPAAALLCSSADPAAVPGGAVLDTIPSDTINSILNLAATPPFLTGSTSYTLTNSQPFITARTFVYNPAQSQSGSVGSFTMPVAQLRGLTRGQYNEFWALPNLPDTPRNNAIAFVVFPAGTQFWSGLTGPITDPGTGLFWGNGGGLQYYAGKQVTGQYQIPLSNYVLQTPDNGGPVLVNGPRLSGSARAIGSYLDQRCVAAYSDLDRVLTSLDVLNLANPANAAPLAAAVSQFGPDRYGALPLMIGRQHTQILDVLGGRTGSTGWPGGDVRVSRQAIVSGVSLWGRVLGDSGRRGNSSTMPGYRTATAGGLAGFGYEDGSGLVLGIGGGHLASSANWSDTGGSSGDTGTSVLGAYGGAALGRLLIGGAAAGTYSQFNVSRRIVIPDGGLGIQGLSTAISRTANGTAQAAGMAARLDFGTKLRIGKAAVKPFAGLSYGRVDRHGFTETNAGGVNLVLGREVSGGLRSRLGAAGRYELMPAGALAWALEGDLIWTRRLQALPGGITAGLEGQSGSFSIASARDDLNSLQTGLALKGSSPGGHVSVRYDGDFRPEFRAHAVTAGMAFKF